MLWMSIDDTTNRWFKRWLLLGLAWVATTTVISELDITSKARYLGFIMALFCSPLAFFWSLKQSVNNRSKSWLWGMALPPVAVIIYEFTFYIPHTTNMWSAVWLVVGAIACGCILYLRSIRVQHVFLMAVVGAVWWSCWGIFVVAVIPMPSQPYTSDIRCACYMKEAAKNAGIIGKRDVTPNVMASSSNKGETDHILLQCPITHKNYIVVPQKRLDADTGGYVLICPYHENKMVALTREGKTVFMDKRQMSVIQRIRSMFCMPRD